MKSCVSDQIIEILKRFKRQKVFEPFLKFDIRKGLIEGKFDEKLVQG